ncbi:RidA family protein [Halobellus ruber]|uniref:RidA family protein n=1 Tax=Halobellus ruber TaxID=2761102 RepID=A0A7J9SJF0_9EURY|nr:RidA family protein [Halobellus ruber]MBB6646107.1 RidA family protein [Halobellus ruber]
MQPIAPDLNVESAPLSPAMRHDGRIYVSGQVPIDPDTGAIVGDTIEPQAGQALENVRSVLAEADASLSDVIKVQVFLVDTDDFPGLDATYAEVMPEPYPARSAFEVGGLAADVRVEIEAIAVV